MRTFYISTGQKGMKYTLRHRWVAMGVYEMQQKDEFCCVLTTNWDDSVKKAHAYLKKHYGSDYKLYGDEFELNAIIRRSAEEIAEEERLEREAAAARAISQVKHNAYENTSSIKKVARDGLFTFGKYSKMHGGRTFEKIVADDLDYIRFCIESAEERIGFDLSSDEHPRRLTPFEVGALGLRKWCEQNNVDWTYRPHLDSRHIGTVGEKITVEVTIEKRASEYFQVSQWTDAHSFKFTSVNDSGDLVVFKTSAKAFHSVDAGDKIVVEGTVKSHSEWNGIQSTYMNRVKVVA